MRKPVISMLLCLILLVSLAAPAVYAQQPSEMVTGDDLIIGENVALDDAQVDETSFTRTEKREEIRLTGEASVTLDGATISAQGIPEGGTVTVENTQLPGARQAVVSELGLPGAQELFSWEICVQDASGADWQPEGTVAMELTLPDVKLHKYSKVYVLHEAEDGTRSYIAARVTEEGTVSFITDGFSGFAGFVVDFDYEGASFSMDGLDSILLSDLMDQLKAPLYIEDVASVSFSDPGLLSVDEQANGDWLLTSLQAFSTTEALTVTMNDGNVYAIAVTDAQYATVTYSGKTVQTDGLVEWWADDDGIMRWYEGWSSSGDIYIRDGKLDILIHPDPAATSYLVCLKRLIIENNAEVTIRLSDEFTTASECVIRTTDGSHVVKVVSGSLTLQGISGGTRLVVDGNADYSIYNPLIQTEDAATMLSASDVIFRNGANGGVWIRSSVIALSFTDCTFENTVRTTANNGGAIWIFERELNTTDYVQVTDFIVSGCQFQSNAAANGGAIAMAGKVYKCSITNSHFTGCAANEGGAINISGSVGDASISGCFFTNCVAAGSGGAINAVSDAMDEAGRDTYYSRMTLLSVSDCSFTGCQATAYSGGGICISMQVSKLSVSGCDFTDCVAAPGGGGYRGGGAICLSYKTLPADFDGTWTMVMPVEGVTISDEYYTWGGTTKETVIQEVEIKGSADDLAVIENCSTGNQGGGIMFVPQVYVGEASIDYVHIDGCKTATEGSAIFLGDCIVKSLEITNSLVENCSFTGTTRDGGTIRVLGSTTCVLYMEGCTIRNNSSHNDGGGLYWNANAINRGGVTACSATLRNCTFEGNTAGRSGGGIYCASVLNIYDCEIKSNTAVVGGGIYQMVYTNANRTITEGETTELTLDPDTKVSGNNAANGAGIAVICNATASIDNNSTISYTVKFCLNGASVYSNKASENGGGIYFRAETYDDAGDQAEVDRFTKEVLIDNGTIRDNLAGNGASGNGGGIYMDSSENTKLEIVGGDIHSNTANKGNGGGIYMTGKNATCTITGGVIGGEDIENSTPENPVGLPNHAVRAGGVGGNGGGIAISGGAHIDMKLPEGQTVGGGTISYNIADNDGGGIWLDESGENGIANAFKIEEGLITRNTADHVGGAIAMFYRSAADLNGGEITYNTAANDGGGLYAYYYANITMDGGAVQHNTATKGNGGGIFAQYYGTVTIKEGSSISGNNAGQQGGGIYSYRYNVSITGGVVENNMATDGGGIAAYRDTGEKISVSGGDIQYNTATKNGGGIYAYRTTVELTGGKISENTAVNGGGLYIVGGAELTVNNGFVIRNKAISTESAALTTCYLEHDNLMGVGGGIYLANGGEVLSKFTLEGDSNYAIYGNLASFAADDVFANGQNTQLRVPTVANMSLADYPFPATGWVEDYPFNDSAYEEGLNHGAAKGVENGKNVFRYRNSDAYYRIQIPERDVTADTFTPNAANAYVCMTLGIPCALPDTVIIDYGLNVKIHVRENDIGITEAGLVGVGQLRPTERNSAADFTRDALDPSWNVTDNPCRFGIATVNSDHTVTYTPRSLSMDREDAFSYAIAYVHTDGTTYYFYSTVTVIPATSLYYEDNITDGTNALITYDVYQLTREPGGVVTESRLEDETWGMATETGAFGVQNEDRPGSMSEHDANKVYGFDDAYAACTTWSLGNARKVTVNDERTATATFSFKGTGFEVYSMTSNKTGTVMVTVKRLDAAEDDRCIMVDTYYGYVYNPDTKQWEVSESADANGLYQIPVIKMTDMPYGEYFVELYVAYTAYLDHNQRGSCDFYLDAIRIFDPADNGSNSQIVTDAYVADREGWPVYQELRNMILDADTFVSTSVEDVSGIVFVDGKSDGVTVSQYKSYGPNNEVYLAPGQSIVFDLNKDQDLSGIAGVHLGIKSVGSQSAGVAIYRVENGQKEVVLDTDITTATERYYDITDANGGSVVICNDGTTGILSITNVKTTHTSGITPYQRSSFCVGTDSVNRALDTVFAQTPTIRLQYPSLSFESEINYNIYYAVEGAEVSPADMGLITFAYPLEEGTVEDAVQVFSGAVSKDGLYMVRTAGVPAKNMGDSIYFKVYLKLNDGSYIYSKLESYSAVDYARSTLSNDRTEPKLKQLIIAMLNYGSAAQRFFGYNTDTLMNDFLTQEQKTTLVGYTSDLLSPVYKLDASKEGSFTSNGGFTAAYPSVTFGGAFDLNYYLTPAHTPEDGVTMYFWDLQTCERGETLTAENAIRSIHITREAQGIYIGSFADLAAKQIDQTIFAAAVYEAQGQTWTSGVWSYSLGAYCVSQTDDARMQEIAEATAVYGYYAKAYLANI